MMMLNSQRQIPAIKKFEGNIEDYFTFIEKLRTILKEQQLEWLLNPDQYPNPKLHDTIKQRLRLGTSTERDQDHLARHEMAIQKLDAKATMAIEIVSSALGETILSRIDFIKQDYTISPRRQLLDIIRELKRTFGSWNPANQLRLSNKLHKIPYATNLQQVELVANQLNRINNELAALRPESKLGDPDLIARFENLSSRVPPLDTTFERIAYKKKKTLI